MLLKNASQSRHMDDLRAFVVGGPSPVKATIANFGFKSGTVPKIERIGRLHVVMTVNDQMRQRRVPASAENDGMYRGLDDFDRKAQLIETGYDKFTGGRNT